MTKTRSQTAAGEKTTNIYEDSPASPSDIAPSTATAMHAPPAPRPGPSRAATDPSATEPPRTTERRRAPSVSSRRSTNSANTRIKQAEWEAQERLAELQRRELQIQATLIQSKLAADVATIREETDRESLGEDDVEAAEERISSWLHQTQTRGEDSERYMAATKPSGTERHTDTVRASGIERHADAVRASETERRRAPARATGMERGPSPACAKREERRQSPTRARERTHPHTTPIENDHGIERLATALERMTRTRGPARQPLDLPLFSGAKGEWLPFKAAMRESALHAYSPAENLARMRTCLRGEAKQTVSALLYTATDPEIIMKTLEQCYGRPEIIIDEAFEDIKKLPRLGATAADLNSFAIKLQNIVTVIGCLDERGYLQNPMLTREVIDKLTPHIKSRWCDYAEDYGRRDEAEIVTLSHFLMREADRAMRHTYATNTATSARTSKPAENMNRRRGANVYATNTEEKTVCLCCGANHATPKCNRLGSMTVAKRWEWAKETKICFRCLNSKHRRFHCKAKKCGIDECRQPHHALLHATRGDDDKPPVREESVVAASTHVASMDKVLLKVCPVTITGRNGRELNTYALLDEGSTITLIDEEIAVDMGLQGPRRPLNIHGVTSSQREPDSRMVDLNIRGQAQKKSYNVKARTVSNLTLGSQSVTKDALRHAHLRDLPTEAMCYTNAKPRMLIGADNWHLIVTRRLLAAKSEMPAASLTHLGWVLHGRVPRSVITEGETVLHIHTQPEHRRDSLEEEVKAHFDIDALGVSMNRRRLPKEERACEVFEDTVKRVDNRYEVGLPWRQDDIVMPPSYDMAVRRLRGIEKKMDQSLTFRDAYTAQVDRLLEKGYAKKYDGELDRSPHSWYLPHFAVTNPNKPGKIRMVFDAAARSNGVCLNDMLLDGPDLLHALHGVLFRFREKPVAVTADVREMFLQIKIRPEDRAAQRFLWRGDDRAKPPEKYEMTSMIFGARSSPFLAHSVRDRNATEHKDRYPLAYDAITRNHYMDDWLDSFDTENEAKETIAEVRTVHMKAGFELAGWSSNIEDVLTGIPLTDRANVPRELGANAHAYEKTLGIRWRSQTDELTFNTDMNRVPSEVKTGERTPTKREALGTVMSLFDPLGILSQYTITAKIMLQGLWRKQLGWDEPLPPEEATAFRDWLEDLEYVKRLRLPRCYGVDDGVARRQLHVFCDASEQAFATAAYWRFIDKQGKINVILVAGKAKVAPMKAQSIPRMELQASLIGARLAAEIVKEHRIETEVTYWSDSKTALHWIRNDATRYTPYVEHRLSEIAELTRPEQWRWVPTAHNVADDATRAGNTKVRDTDRWFIGPGFLYEEEANWPTEEPTACDSDQTVAHVQESPRLIDITRFSSHKRLLRAVAYVALFADKCRRRATTLELRHLDIAELLLIKQAQSDSFTAELRTLKSGKKVDRTSRLHKLDPIVGEDGLIKLNSRICAAAVPEHQKRPPVLDGTHPLARLIIRQEHEAQNHVGREQIVNNLRQRYWILRLRPVVRTVLRSCATCIRHRAKVEKPVKGDLPRARLDAYARPFTRCGIDCFGPMWVAIGRRREKRWGMLFTCLVTRAIHVEAIASLSTDSAIMAMRRMAARRGWPEHIISDNGTNFRGADVELRSAFNEWLTELKDFALTKQVKWSFIDPGAPNQGGAWERMIRSVKTALAVTLNERAPKEEVLYTLLTEIEHTVNARPLTHVSVSHEDFEALTPNHFLLGSSTGLPHVGTCDVADKRVWRAAQALANMFWSRWIKEYLPTLIPRGDVRTRKRNVAVNDLVIIADGLLPRNVWPRGRIERVYTGPDGVVRSADVRTRGGIFRRPVKRLVVLPMMEEGCEDLRRGEYVTDNERAG